LFKIGEREKEGRREGKGQQLLAANIVGNLEIMGRNETALLGPPLIFVCVIYVGSFFLS
jgi:hypothetical protein